MGNYPATGNSLATVPGKVGQGRQIQLLGYFSSNSVIGISGNSPWSVATWVNLASTTNNGAIWSLGKAQGSQKDIMVLATQQNNTTDLKYEGWGNIGLITDIAGALNSGTLVGVWNQFVMTYDSTNLRLYVNGQGPFSVLNPGGMTIVNEVFSVGIWNNWDGNYIALNSVIDEVAVFDDAISLSDVQDLYTKSQDGLHYCDSSLINSFSQATATPGEIVTSTINKQDLVTKIQQAGSDTYFDSTSELYSVHVRYEHEENRQRKTIVHTGPGLTGNVSWLPGARDGTWEQMKVISYDSNAAKSVLTRSDIGSDGDLVMSDGTVALNT